MALQPSKLTLYSRVTSSCTARVQIAANLKKIPLTINPCDGKKLFKDKSYLEMNPNGTVPTLVADYENGESLTMSQSLSMLDFLEDSYPGGMRLIPPVTDMKARCKARDLALLIACDIQPLQSSRIGNNIKRLGHDSLPWTRECLVEGMEIYESMVQQSAGKYSVGDKLSIADICLVSMVGEAYKVGLHFDRNPKIAERTHYPIIQRVVKACEKLPAFRDNFTRLHFKSPTWVKHLKRHKDLGEKGLVDEPIEGARNKSDVGASEENFHGAR